MERSWKKARAPTLTKRSVMRLKLKDRERKKAHGPGYYDQEEVPKPKGVKAAEALVSVKAAQSKVNLVLGQLVSSPFTCDIETVRPQKNFSISKFNQYDPKSKPDKILTTNT